MSAVYKINKGINKPIEFKGLKAQYIGYLGAGLVLLLILFALLYVSGVHTAIGVSTVAVLGTVLFMAMYKLSNTFGQHGLIKKIARYSIPDYLIAGSRKFFYQQLLELPKTNN